MTFEWYRGMVNERTGRLVYTYDPETNFFDADRSPIRDIASVWDMEILGDFLGRRDLEPVIERSLEHYSRSFMAREGPVILNPALLGEPSSIAHSAFMILSLLHSRLPDRIRHAGLLAGGILAQQRPDGSYKTYFGPEQDDGLDFYPGEAMLALLETFRMTREKKYLDSAEKGFAYYRDHYYGKNRVEPAMLVYFANWQSQFCRLLYEDTQKAKLKKQVGNYLFLLHDKIIGQKFYGRVKRSPERQISVEVACALEGLNDAYAVALQENDDRTESYRQALCVCLAYASKLQCVQNCREKERGGFGFSLSNRTQRIDVTGHFVSGMIKSLRNGILCSMNEQS